MHLASMVAPNRLHHILSNGVFRRLIAAHANAFQNRFRVQNQTIRVNFTLVFDVAVDIVAFMRYVHNRFVFVAVVGLDPCSMFM